MQRPRPASRRRPGAEGRQLTDLLPQSSAPECGDALPAPHPEDPSPPILTAVHRSRSFRYINSRSVIGNKNVSFGVAVGSMRRPRRPALDGELWHEGRHHRGCRSRWAVGRLATEALGHGAAGSRSPRRGPDPLRASRTVLAELGRSRLRRSGVVDRRPAQRGRRRRGGGAGLVEGSVDERQVHPQRPHRDLPVPDPDAAGRAGGGLDRRAQGRRRGAAVRQRGSAAARASPARPGSNGSTTSRTSGRSPTSSATCPTTRPHCSRPRSPGRAATWTRSRPARASATSAWCGTSARASTGASSAARPP